MSTQQSASILASLEPRIGYMAAPFARRGSELADLMQEGRIALLDAAKTWDPSRGVELWTYARRQVRWALIRYWRKERRETDHDFVSSLGGEDDGNETTDVFDLIPADGPSPEEQLEVEEIFALLTDVERQVLWSHFGEDKPVSKALPGAHHCKAQRVYKGALEKLRGQVAA